MCSAVVCLVLICSSALGAAQTQDTRTTIESVGTLITVDVRPGAKEIATDLKANVGDLLQFRITSPAMGRVVLSLQVSVDGDAKKVAVVNTAAVVAGKPEPGSEGVSIFIVPERRGRATVKIVFVDNEGKPFRRTYNIELVGR